MIQVWLINSLLVTFVVLVHYECLFRLTRIIPKLKIESRYRILVGVFGALIAHAVEIWIFALSYFLLDQNNEWGGLVGESATSFMDCVYFSFTVFTTVGFGDIVPIGKLRYLVGIEALTGLVLITWSASFLFFEMQKYWSEE